MQAVSAMRETILFFMMSDRLKMEKRTILVPGRLEHGSGSNASSMLPCRLLNACEEDSGARIKSCTSSGYVSPLNIMHFFCSLASLCVFMRL